MTSPNEAKLEELRKEARQYFFIAEHGASDQFIDRAFQLGRMEQHDRDVDAVEKSYDGESALSGMIAAREALESTSPVEGEE